MRTKIVTIVIILFFVMGVGFISYPIIGAIVSDYTSTKVVQNYENQVSSMNDKQISHMKKKYKALNDKLKQIMGNPLENFRQFADKKGTKQTETRKKVFKEGDVLGYLSIPKINVLQPICEGTKEATLSHSVGHLTGTSLPYGGLNTHCCITGHSGLSYSTMLSELEKVQVGDTFYIKVLNETHQYEVDSKRIVKPYGADKYLKIEKGKDYCTVATCYPVVINTHRLLVRGHRVPYDGGLKKAVDDKINSINMSIIIAASIAFAVIVLLVVVYVIRKRKRRKNLRTG